MVPTDAMQVAAKNYLYQAGLVPDIAQCTDASDHLLLSDFNTSLEQCFQNLNGQQVSATSVEVDMDSMFTLM